MVLGHVLDDRTKDVLTSQSIAFDSMLLEPYTLRGLNDSGFYKPSPIQLCGIPLGKCGFDLLLEAKSGTGKTAVFTVIALEKIDLDSGLQTVILAPTREIAAQVCDVIKQIGSSYEGLKVAVVMGGLPFEEDVKKFKKGNVHIVVGSPGRLRHLIQEKLIDVSAVRLLVLDEADKLVEKCFILDINYIFSILPKEKQVIMSSATYPETAKELIEKYVQNAQHICPDSNSILLGIQQKVTCVEHNSNIVKQTKHRFEELAKILSNHTFKQCLIFCNYQARVADIHKLLKRKQWPAQQLYGQQEQLERLDALRSLQEYKCRILISTDLAARGIDASNVDLVINFEPPYDWQTYLHRIGRAGRFGSYGLAITILSEGSEQRKFTEILKALNAPVNISSLWTDKELIIGEQKNANSKDNEYLTTPVEKPASEPAAKPTPVTNIEEKVINYTALWNILSNDSAEDCLDLESFDNLCQSFGKPEIESFSDLMHSLQIYEPPKPTKKLSGETDTYKHLQIPIEDYLNTVSKIIKKVSSKQHQILATPMQHTSGTNTILEKNNSQQSVKYNSVNKTNQGKEINGTLINKKTFCNVKHETESLKQNSKDKTDKEYDEWYYKSNIDEDLLKAGLPTAFGSSKMKNNRDKRKNNLETSDVQHQHSLPTTQHSTPNKIEDLFKNNFAGASTSEKHANRRNTYKQSFQSVYKESLNLDTESNFGRLNKTTRKPHSASTSSTSKNLHQKYSSTYSSSSETYESERRASSSFQSSKKIITNKQNNQKQHNYEAKQQQRVSYEDYCNWYHNLKLKVQQIDLALYIEEMSKL